MEFQRSDLNKHITLRGRKRQPSSDRNNDTINTGQSLKRIYTVSPCMAGSSPRRIALLVGRCLLDNMSVMIDKCRHPGIGGTNKPASIFFGMHLYHLQMLPRSGRTGSTRASLDTVTR